MRLDTRVSIAGWILLYVPGASSYGHFTAAIEFLPQCRILLLGVFTMFLKKLIKNKVPQPWDNAQKMRLDVRIHVAGGILL